MFCPFIKGDCRNDCVFHCQAHAASKSMTNDTLHCILAIRVDSLNEHQADQLSEIIDLLKGEQVED